MPISEIEHQLKYSTAIREARLKGIDVFHSWFNISQSVNQTVVAGFWDLSFHILTDKVCEFLDKSEEKIALEIGYGGGRILNAACHYFKEVIGIDIHGEQKMVEDFLRSQGKKNFKLIKTSGSSIDLDSDSIDFVYSFIVFQHLPSFGALTRYMKETHRVLKMGGLAQIYFGRYSKLNFFDRIRYFFKGYKEITDAPVNHTSLVVKVSKVKQLSRWLGFAVLETGPSFKGVPSGYPKRRGGQNYITLKK